MVVLLLAGPVRGQSALVLRPVPESVIEVDGTSNQSDWSVAAEEATGRFVLEETDAGPVVSEAEIHVPSDRMKSPRGIIMDRLMKGALKASQFGDIAFVLNAPATAVSDGEGWLLTAPGTLTIAGQSKEVQLEVHAVRAPDGTWRFTGSQVVAMTDYGMRPPTAMFGALVTGNEVTVRFDVVAAAE